MRRRMKVEVRGAVQGVGFRPFVYRLARKLSLGGRVGNDPRGVVIEVEGAPRALESFLRRLDTDKPRPAEIDETVVSWLEPAGHDGFRIVSSGEQGAKTTRILPDIATCEACRSEVLDSADRRHGYPFTNCTHCGPRFSVIRSLPYDRPRTTMERFAMCEACRAEYADPADRRFHAQPNACPGCGPELALWDAEGRVVARRGRALERAVDALRQGRILAVKGLGGFHLMVDAGDERAVARLRARKPRREKPFALMVRDLEQAGRLCRLDDVARDGLSSPEAPVLLLRRRDTAPVADAVAPANPYLGVMLPYTPLHHLLMAEAGFPVVATSGNLSDEPICTDEREALDRLGGVADVFLVHDRPIARHVDDSVSWVVDGRARLLRRARGHAPRPVLLDREAPVILAVGAHLKNTVALSVGRQVFVSQHIGDMETPQAMDAFEKVIRDFAELYAVAPTTVAHDLHPDYLTRRWAEDAAAGGPPGAFPVPPRLVGVQHHHAHLAACLADNAHPGPALGVIWDGTGYGTDGTVWGGEFLLGDARSFRRVAHLLPFRLPGAEAAVREPRRSALALLWEMHGDRALERDDLAAVGSFRPAERRVLGELLRRGIRAPRTTSAGRLFDGVAALIGLRQRASFEGQAAMALEFVADAGETGAYPIELREPGEGGTARIVDWRPTVEAVLEDRGRGAAPDTIAARFHNALVEGILSVARAVGHRTVALSGGCHQNRLLVERAVARLRSDGFEVLLHRQVPPNDGGVSLGQVAVAAAVSGREGPTGSVDAARYNRR